MPLLTPKRVPHVFRQDERIYLKEGLRMPSVTTVLGATADKSWLERWIAKVGPAEAERIKTAAAFRGTKLHERMERLLVHGLEPAQTLLSDEPEVVAKLWKGLRPMLDRISDVHLVEGQTWNVTDYGAYCGTIDLVARIDDGPLRILDLKTSTKPKPKEWCGEYTLQLAFYSGSFNYTYQTEDVRADLGGLLVVDEQSLRCQLHLFDEDEMETARWTALHRLQRYYQDKGLDPVTQYALSPS
jgi:genome maintenance exonuclease 1